MKLCVHGGAVLFEFIWETSPQTVQAMRVQIWICLQHGNLCRMPGLSNTPYDVCHRLMELLRQKGYTLYVDNYYCNSALCESLSAENTQVVDTVRAIRISMPQDLTNQRLRPGEWDHRQWNHTVYVKWKDKRGVHIVHQTHPSYAKSSDKNRKEKETNMCGRLHQQHGRCWQIGSNGSVFTPLSQNHQMVQKNRFSSSHSDDTKPLPLQ